jgi:hypothetical protein
VSTLTICFIILNASIEFVLIYRLHPVHIQYTSDGHWMFREYLANRPCLYAYPTSNDNGSETKAKESFDNSVFFDIEAKRTPLLESKLFFKRSEHIR